MKNLHTLPGEPDADLLREMIGFAAQFLRKAAAAIARVLHATWQGCRMHFARARWPAGPPCRVSLYCPKLPKLAALLTEVETGVLAYMSFPSQHRAEPFSTNTLERVNGEIRQLSRQSPADRSGSCRTNVVAALSYTATPR